MIILLCGKKRAGKTTGASFLADYFKSKNKKVSRPKMAAKLKRVLEKRFRFEKGYLDTGEGKQNGFTFRLTKLCLMNILNKFGLQGGDITREQAKTIPTLQQFAGTRHLMQWVGTDLLRKFDEDIHLKNLTIPKKADILILDDIRFQNEYDYMKTLAMDKKMKFLPIMITRSEVEDGDTHASEKCNIKGEFKPVENEGDLKEFEKRLLEAVKND